MLQNKIYQNYIIEIFKTFLTILFGLTVIAWTVRAVNFLDLIVESGYPLITYFQYSFLNIFGILTKFIPLSFLVALSIFIAKQIQENELIILLTSGVKKIQIVHLFLFCSILMSIFYIIFSVFITPTALNKSRQILGNENLASFLPTVKVQQFSDSFSGITFIVDEKVENQIQNIFLQDRSNNLKNISAGNIEKDSTTIIAGSGLVEENKMVLFNGQIISSTKDNNKNHIVKFEQLNINLSNLQNTTIKKPKIQETSTYRLLGCLNNNYFNDEYCRSSFKDEILPTLNRRIVFPLFFPTMALISSFLLIRSKKTLLLNKVSVFGYCFIALLFAELTIRYSGLSKILNNLFFILPIILSFFTYIFLKYKFLKESIK